MIPSGFVNWLIDNAGDIGMAEGEQDISGVETPFDPTGTAGALAGGYLAGQAANAAFYDAEGYIVTRSC